MTLSNNGSSLYVPSSLCTRADDSFRSSIIPQCRGGFDFTLLFEQSVLSLAPLIMLLFAVPVRLIELVGTDVKTIPSRLHLVKVVSHDLKIGEICLLGLGFFGCPRGSSTHTSGALELQLNNCNEIHYSFCCIVSN